MAIVANNVSTTMFSAKVQLYSPVLATPKTNDDDMLAYHYSIIHAAVRAPAGKKWRSVFSPFKIFPKDLWMTDDRNAWSAWEKPVEPIRFYQLKATAKKTSILSTTTLQSAICHLCVVHHLQFLLLSSARRRFFGYGFSG